MGEFMFGFAVVMAISVIVDWITLLILKKNMNFMSTVVIAFAIYFMWIVIAAGGILR